jgi:hypothetical protein
LHAQDRTSIFIGDGSGSSPDFSADSIGLVIPNGELVIGTGSKAPGSTDSLYWNAGLYIEGPLNLMALPNLTESANDSVLLINTSGNVFKSVLGKNFFTANGTATGHRAHDFDNFNLTISDIGNFTITANTNWQFGTTANDINISAITGLGMSIATTGGSNFIAVSSGNFIDLSAPDIILDAPDIFLEDALTLSTWDTILVRHPTTGEIQGRLASTIGKDSLGRNGTAGRIVFETATKAPNSSANLFWDNSNIRLGIGTGTPSYTFHAYDAGAVNTAIESGGDFGVRLRIKNTVGEWTNEIASSTGVYQVRDVTNNITAIRAYVSSGIVVIPTGALGIGGVPVASAKLEVNSTTQGLLLPRMTSTQRDAIGSPAAGLLIYNTTTTKVEVYNGSWTALH